jgi:soluble lytic murein transglycosylase-like protein
MRQESGFKPCAVSIKGAQGLMQLMPATAAQFHVTDPFDPEQNVQAGALFLKQLLKKYNGDLRLALVAYNAGSTRADQLDPSQYPAETQGYLANIFADLGNPE